MNSSRPYLIRAIYQWIVDNDLTPYLLVNANAEHVKIPLEYVSNGKIILNISPSAVHNLELANEEIRFNARFSGNAMFVVVPINATMAVYAKENGRGMVFTEDDDTPPPTPPDPGEKNKSDDSNVLRKPPSLRVVK